MAHADHAWSRDHPTVRKVCDKVGRHIAIMMDVKGPEIRTGDVPETFELEQDEIFEFTSAQGIGGVTEEGIRRVDVNYPGFSKDINVGDTILVDSGLIRLRVLRIDTSVRCQAHPRPHG